MKSLPLREFIIAIVLAVVLAALLLPSLARSREGSRRCSCQNNLKQWGLVAKMFANEHNGLFPPVSPVPNNWIMDMDAIYPEYFSDPSMLVCPSSPAATPNAFRLRNVMQHPGEKVGEFHPDCASSLFYIYTGFAINSEAEAAALADALAGNAAGDRDLLLDVPIWAEEPSTESPDSRQAQQPIMWDRLSLIASEANHTPAGANVVYQDGHVEFIPYGYYNAGSRFPVTPVSAEIFSALPLLPEDCS